MKEIEANTNKCSWIERNNIVKMSLLPKASVDSMQSLSIPMTFSIVENNLKLMQNYKRPQIAEVILRKNKGGIALPDFKLYHKAIVIKTVWYWRKTTEKRLLDTSLGKEFLDMTPKTLATEARINKWGYIKLKRFCTAKTTK